MKKPNLWQRFWGCRYWVMTLDGYEIEYLVFMHRIYEIARRPQKKR